MTPDPILIMLLTMRLLFLARPGILQGAYFPDPGLNPELDSESSESQPVDLPENSQ